MEITFSEEDVAWDRTLLNYSSKCAEPLAWAYSLFFYRLVAPLEPHKFNNCQNKIVEIAVRIFIALAGFVAISSLILPVSAFILAVANRVLRALGFILQKNNYTHVKGSLPEKILQNGTATIMTWNVCGIYAGIHYNHGGVNPWRERIDEITEKIIQHDVDVLVLQEIYDTAFAEALIERLNNNYAHFFIHLGPNIVASSSGEIVLTKCAVHRFNSTSFENNYWWLNRTFTNLEIKANPLDQAACMRIIGTHFIDGNPLKQIEQFNQILKDVENEAHNLPTVLMGDLNLQRDHPLEGGLLNAYLEHSYTGQEPTCTSKLLQQWSDKLYAPDEWIDYISIFKNYPSQVQLGKAELIQAFDATYNTKTALSDHHGLKAVLHGLTSLK